MQTIVLNHYRLKNCFCQHFFCFFTSFYLIHLVPGFEGEALSAVFAVGGNFGVAEDAEGFAGVIVAHDGFGVEDVFEVAAA